MTGFTIWRRGFFRIIRRFEKSSPARRRWRRARRFEMGASRGLILFWQRGRWGSVGRSRDPGLHGRRPVFATPRALALSYVDPYVDFTGRVKGYAVVDLRTLGTYDWRLAETNVWKVERLLLDYPHRPINTSDARFRRLRARYRAYREAHGGRKPIDYRGRERWTELPREFDL